jgi:hypothetical protein
LLAKKVEKKVAKKLQKSSKKIAHKLVPRWKPCLHPSAGQSPEEQGDKYAAARQQRKGVSSE